LGWVSFLNPTYGSKKKIDPPLGGKKRKRVKRVKREKGLQSPPSTAHHPKTEVADVAVGEEAVAESGTAESRIEEPRTAPQWRTIIITIFYPSTAILWCILIAIL